MTSQNLILLLTAVLCALIAGLFYGYSCSVNPGLGKLTDAEYLGAMQSINREIRNPVFFASFMGTLILLPVCTWLHYSKEPTTVFYLLLSATMLYAIGSFGVTIFGNVPLNDALDKADLSTAGITELNKFRSYFEGTWNRLHNIRTWANLGSLVLVLLSLLKK